MKYKSNIKLFFEEYVKNNEMKFAFRKLIYLIELMDMLNVFKHFIVDGDWRNELTTNTQLISC